MGTEEKDPSKQGECNICRDEELVTQDQSLEDESSTLQEEHIEKLNGEIAELCKQLSAVQEERDQYRNAYGRLRADFDNFRRRKEKEISELKEAAVSDLVLSLLPVIDNLERALFSSDSGGTEAISSGVELVLRQFIAVLESFGVKVIKSIGEPFDPEFHEAAERVETKEFLPGTVVEELLKGYSLRGRVLRASMVKVAYQPEETQ